jgi:hypothetical protein
MVLFGAIYFMLPRVLHWEWPYPRLISLQFWLAAIGIGIYFVGLTIGGWLQGLAMLDAAALHGVGALTIPYLQWRSVGGALMVLSHLVFVGHFLAMALRFGPQRTGAACSRRKPRPWRSPMENEVKLTARRHGDAGHGGVRAGRDALHAGARRQAARGPQALHQRQLRGREVYIANGCVYCHSSSRATATSPPTMSAAGAGPRCRATTCTTSRTCWAACAPGPTCSTSARASQQDWHLGHLYQPRAYVPGSIMPSYPYLFETKAAAEPGDEVEAAAGPRPRRQGGGGAPEALDLVKYLQGLNHTYRAAAPAAQRQPARRVCFLRTPMLDQDTSHRAQERENADPEERIRPMPLMAAAITLAMVLFGVGYIFLSDPFGNSSLGDRRTVADLSGPHRPPPAQPWTARRCSPRSARLPPGHGQGPAGRVSAAGGSEWVTGEPRVLANILLHGVTGEIRWRAKLGRHAGLPSAGRRRAGRRGQLHPQRLEQQGRRRGPAVRAERKASDAHHAVRGRGGAQGAGAWAMLRTAVLSLLLALCGYAAAAGSRTASRSGPTRARAAWRWRSSPWPRRAWQLRPQVAAPELPALLAQGGGVTIVDFIYTRCQTVCLSLGSSFQQLQAALLADAGRASPAACACCRSASTARTTGRAARLRPGPAGRPGLWRFVRVPDAAQQQACCAAWAWWWCPTAAATTSTTPRCWCSTRAAAWCACSMSPSSSWRWTTRATWRARAMTAGPAAPRPGPRRAGPVRAAGLAPLRHALEASMWRHMVLQFPLLMAAGALLAAACRRARARRGALERAWHRRAGGGGAGAGGADGAARARPGSARRHRGRQVRRAAAAGAALRLSWRRRGWWCRASSSATCCP